VIYAPLGFLQDERFPLMAFVYHQVFADESGKFHQDPLIAFCAVTATAERLSSFDQAWRTLLRSYEVEALHMERASRLVEDFGWRMRKGDTVDERTNALLPFADLINKHLEMGVTQAWDVRGFNHLSRAVLKTLGGSNDPYFLAFVRGLAQIADKVGEDDRISIICDDDPHTAWDLYVHYRSLGKADFTIQKKAISLSFANDKHFPALQAADMLAFLTRHEAAEQFNGVTNIWRRLYDRLMTQPEPPYGIMRWFRMFADEDQLVEFAREAQAVAERVIREREEKRNRVRKIRPSNDAASESEPRRDEGKTGRGESREEKAEIRGELKA
jgi:Protein of unknown function (DUF3800)